MTIEMLNTIHGPSRILDQRRLVVENKKDLPLVKKVKSTLFQVQGIQRFFTFINIRLKDAATFAR